MVTPANFIKEAPLPTYNNIDHELELKIRRGFSHDLNRFKGMKCWLDGAFQQMVANRSDMYSFNSRVKQVEDLLRKLDEKIESNMLTDDLDWTEVDSYDDLKLNIDDIVGGRLITFFVKDIPDLMIYLTGFKHFCVREITIHDMLNKPVLYQDTIKKLNITDEVRSNILTSLPKKQRIQFDVPTKEFQPGCIVEQIPYEIRLNTNGYVGVHLIIQPLPDDDYWKNEPGLYDKFELQIRSLIHEAWSEIQHKVIYKGERMPEDVKLARASQFATLSSILSSCEDGLYDAAHPISDSDET